MRQSEVCMSLLAARSSLDRPPVRHRCAAFPPSPAPLAALSFCRVNQRKNRAARTHNQTIATTPIPHTSSDCSSIANASQAQFVTARTVWNFTTFTTHKAARTGRANWQRARARAAARSVPIRARPTCGWPRF